ncbi:MaoC family dehydratase [Methylovirgula ligni]|nr:MaoC family dehydratase [Methylovirgula ligni]
MFYALSIGMGLDPDERRELGYVYERDLQAVPTMAVVLAQPSRWIEQLPTGIDYSKVVHGEQGLVMHRSLPSEGTVVSKTNVVDIIDKGAGKGALLITRRMLHDKSSGALIATISQTIFCRADGGFGGTQRPAPAVHYLPERPADMTVKMPTSPQAALLYRLNGDLNPLHADPDVAAKAGFPRPILHGLATYGVAARAILKTVCGYDGRRLRSLSCRFSAPVFPGDTLQAEIWQDGDVASFRLRAIERDLVAVTNGRAEIRPADWSQ